MTTQGKISRICEILAAVFAIVILLPFFLLISIPILLESGGPVIFRQIRVGKDNLDFTIFKLRTMHAGAESQGFLSAGTSDSRVTRVGRLLRAYKLDELPQLFNILLGDMHFVGPRPEVRKYVNLYTPEQMQVLAVKPGLTDYASLEYLHEGDLLAGSRDPEKLYVEDIMPAKLALNLKYIEDKSPGKDLSIILKTIGRIFRG